MKTSNPIYDIQNIESILAKEDQFIFPFRGVSMLPMLRQETDLCTIKRKGSERLKKYDVALYRRQGSDHVYVLHRIVKVPDDRYIFLGDNCINYENVSEDRVVGVMTSFYRGGKGLFSNREISADHKLYLLYARLHLWCFPMRKFYRCLRTHAADFYRHFFPRKP